MPGSRPRQTREKTASILAENLMTIGDEVIIVAVRGYYRDTMGTPGRNDLGIYDDAFFVISPTVHRSFNGNTDPQKAGAKFAKLKPQKLVYYKGKHKGKYWAFRPYPEGVKLPCTRDGIDSMCSATNIHEGGAFHTFSQGCMTLPRPQFGELRTLVYAEMDRYKQKTVRVLLIENK